MQNVRSIPETTFIGMNNKDKIEELKPGYVRLARNCLMGDNQIRKGPGTAVLFNIGTNKVCLGGIATRDEIYAVFNEPGNTLAFIYRYTGSGNPVVVSGANLTANTNVEFVDTGSGVYVLNGVNATGKLVGATYTTPAGIPIGKYGAWYNDRFYITGNTTNKYRLYYSGLNTPDTFGGSDYIEVFPSSRSINTGLASIGGVLVVGKEDSVITFDGFTEDDFTAKQLTEQFPNYGVVSHRSFVNVGDDLLWMSMAAGVPHIRSLKKTSFDKLNYGGVISEDIEGTMKRVDKIRLDQTAGGFDGRYAWWSVPYETSATNNLLLCYDTLSKGWTIHINHNANVFFRSDITGSDRLYYGSSTSLSKVYEVNEEIGSIDTDIIPFRVESRSYRSGVSRKSKWKYTYVKTGSNTDSDIEVSASPDGFTEELQEIISPVVSTSTFPVTFPFQFGASVDRINRVNLKLQPAHTFQLVFEEESIGTTNSFPLTFPITFGADTDLIIKEWDIKYFERGLRDS